MFELDPELLQGLALCILSQVAPEMASTKAKNWLPPGRGNVGQVAFILDRRSMENCAITGSFLVPTTDELTQCDLLWIGYDHAI